MSTINFRLECYTSSLPSLLLLPHPLRSAQSSQFALIRDRQGVGSW